VFGRALPGADLVSRRFARAALWRYTLAALMDRFPIVRQSFASGVLVGWWPSVLRLWPAVYFLQEQLFDGRFAHFLFVAPVMASMKNE